MTTSEKAIEQLVTCRGQLESADEQPAQRLRAALRSDNDAGRRDRIANLSEELAADEWTATARPKRKMQPVYDAASHAATIAARLEQTAPAVDLNDMRDATGQQVMPMDVKTRCLVNLINNDQGMMGDRD